MPRAVIRRRTRGRNLSGAGFWKCSDRVERGQAWQDDATTAYWDLATYFSEPEGRDVLPLGSGSMDGRGHYPQAARKQTASGGVSVMECGQGVRPVMCAERGESVLGHGTGAQAQHGAPTGAGVV